MAYPTGASGYGSAGGEPPAAGGGKAASGGARGPIWVGSAVVAGLGLVNFLFGFLPYVKIEGITQLGGSDTTRTFFQFQTVTPLAFLLLGGVLAGISLLPKQNWRAPAAAASIVGWLVLLFQSFSLDDGLGLGVGGYAVLVLGFVQAVLAVLLLAVEVGLLETPAGRRARPESAAPLGWPVSVVVWVDAGVRAPVVRIGIRPAVRTGPAGAGAVRAISARTGALWAGSDRAGSGCGAGRRAGAVRTGPAGTGAVRPAALRAAPTRVRFCAVLASSRAAARLSALWWPATRPAVPRSARAGTAGTGPVGWSSRRECERRDAGIPAAERGADPPPVGAAVDTELIDTEIARIGCDPGASCTRSGVDTGNARARTLNRCATTRNGTEPGGRRPDTGVPAVARGEVNSPGAPDPRPWPRVTRWFR